jgi:cell division protein FtsB
MITRQRRQNPFKRLWMPLLSAGFLGYFGYHAFSGSFGIWAMDRLEADSARLSVELDALKRQHAALESRVALLRPDSTNADIVDTEARSALNMLRPDEIVIPLGAPQQVEE